MAARGAASYAEDSMTTASEHGGTILCAVDSDAPSEHALRVAAALHARLRMRLVLVQVLPKTRAGGRDPDTARATLIARATALGGQVDVRVEVGPRPDVIARVAGEEGADMIVVSPSGGRRATLRCGLAQELQTVTPVPVLVAAPAGRIPSGERLGRGLRAG
jgi:nucleotide-binding universal stress UspA family protein